MQHGCNARRPLAYSDRCDRRNHRQFGLQQQAVGAAVTNEATVGCTANGAQAKLLRHGVAHLRGRSLRQRIRALVGIAPPEHRERLLAEARQQWGENV